MHLNLDALRKIKLTEQKCIQNISHHGKIFNKISASIQKVVLKEAGKTSGERLLEIGYVN